MAIEQAIVARLVSQAAVTALVSTRVRPKAVSQGTDMPYITYQMITGGAVNSLDGATGTFHWNFQLDIIADTYSEVKAIALVVVNALNGWSDKGSNPSISLCLLVPDGEQDDYDEPQDASEKLIQRIIQEYSIWYSLT